MKLIKDYKYWGYLGYGEVFYTSGNVMRKINSTEAILLNTKNARLRKTIGYTFTARYLHEVLVFDAYKDNRYTGYGFSTYLYNKDVYKKRN